ncbi:AraC family transcriptional regulator [Aestuariirhabdus sp. Z084]|uniref:AraC family transcriptional regulator n=1 Tax=Aestuariirhabdus haliotis TaxID=2918751 RepID=UPI00201B3CA5|nr:AraC family transcriptional regulator [Aestuariirhabdus haliotis]MCL6417133.1 AraC family transcriptional regulator [Aestuariirhabdus haliotis]MCL6421083.1 AraC family transcriptional regulator [Aestuariirhabdus haliotis]
MHSNHDRLPIHNVSAIAAIDLAHELIHRGLLRATQIAGISTVMATRYEEHQQGISIIERRVSEYDFVSLWQIADKAVSSKVFPGTDLGIELGVTVNPQAKGLLANWISCYDTLGQAFTCFQENIRLLNGAESWFSTDQGNQIKLSFNFNSTFTYPTMAIERSMSALLAWSAYFCGDIIDAQSATFTFKAPHHADRYPSIFGDNIRFNANENAICISKAKFEAPLTSANPYLKEILKERSGRIDLNEPSIISAKQQVAALLQSDLMTHSNIDRVSQQLHMSRATLYRKLKEEGTTFSKLLKNERLNRLPGVVSRDCNSRVACEKLGFKDVSSYYKFLKRTEVQSSL